MEATSSLTTTHTLARKIQQLVQNEIVKKQCDTFVSGEWHIHRVHHNPATREHTKKSRIVLDARETTVGGPSLEGIKSDGKRG